jgi:hypothetical protein
LTPTVGSSPNRHVVSGDDVAIAVKEIGRIVFALYRPCNYGIACFDVRYCIIGLALKIIGLNLNQ